MRGLCIVLSCLLALVSVSASLEVEVSISERFVLESFVYSGEPGLVSFELPSDPVSVTSSHPFEMVDRTIVLDADSVPVRFSALFDDLIIKSGSDRVFRSSFSGEPLSLTVVLPQGALFEDSIPSAELSTDGARTSLSWPESSQLSVAVFYEVPSGPPWMLILAFALPILVGFVVFAVYRTRSSTIDALISSDEREVLLRIDGSRTQSEIARELGFSKSKMSKIVRKLEEKGLVGKEPHFKTNRLSRR